MYAMRSDVASWAMLAMVFVAALGCDAGPKKVPSDATKALAKLGDASVESVIITKAKDGSDAAAVEAALDKVMAKGTTVSEKIAVCRETPKGTPAELHLAQPVEVGNVQESFGPPGLKVRRLYPEIKKEIDFYTYGDLEVGVDGSKAVVVVVNK